MLAIFIRNLFDARPSHRLSETKLFHSTTHKIFSRFSNNKQFRASIKTFSKISQLCEIIVCGRDADIPGQAKGCDGHELTENFTTLVTTL